MKQRRDGKMMFKKDLIEKILNGAKTMTSRNKKLYDVGEVTNLMANKNYSKISGKYIKMTKVYQKALGTFTGLEAQKEGFKNLEEFTDYWTKNMGLWDSSKIVWIHEFEIIRKERQEEPFFKDSGLC